MPHDHNDDVPVFVDGDKLNLPPGDTTAYAVLVAAGVDPNHFDLGHKHGNDTTRFNDSDIVTIKPGIRFFTIRECATVA